MSSIEHFNRLKELILSSDQDGLLLRANGLSGFSGEKLTGALQRIARSQAVNNLGCYIEVGVFQGLTLLSVASALKDSPVYGIDDFSQLDSQSTNENLVRKRAEDNSLNNVHLIKGDYEKVLIDLNTYLDGNYIGTYFIDGPHDYRSQLLCLELIKPFLSDASVIIIDDCNYEHVRLATHDFLKINKSFKLLFEAYTDCHPNNMNEEQLLEAKKGWWNGVNIIAKDVNNVLAPMVPVVDDSRELYYNEHIIHSHECAYDTKPMLNFLQSLIKTKFIFPSEYTENFQQFIPWLESLYDRDKSLVENGSMNNDGHVLYPNLNTFSAKLEKFKFNPNIGA